MSNSGPLFGWDLLYNSISKDVRCNEDILFALVHLTLVNHGFQCIGLGDSKNMDGNELKSEALPDGWNQGYKVRYVYQGRLYNLQGTKLDDAIMINLIRPDERSVSMVQLNVRSVVSRTGPLDQMIPNNKDLVKVVRDQLIEKVTKSNKTKEGSSQTPQEVLRRDSNNRRNTPDYPLPGFSQPSPLLEPYPGGLGVGRNDLDPLAGIGGPYMGGIPGLNPLGGGGGMLFQPPGGRMDPAHPGVPLGGMPPGARFDPFRPPDVDRFPPIRRPNPDNDEMPPPGFDDMYM